MELVLIRHGQTPGNAEHRYVGALDQPLNERGRAQARDAGQFPDVPLVYVSNMRRAQETAAIMFPNARQVEVPGVEEMNFGAFAGRSADEMADDPDYQAWVESWCTLPCPGGESRAEFTDRVCESLEAFLRDAQGRGETRVILVAHGGTMMASLSGFGDGSREYYEWLVGNCEGYRLSVDLSGEKPALSVLESGRLEL
ncbi:MAG: histidine phosphatase family protein [Eggerthellaceae bacterium]|nr:histidine phosphatase family protein [Eggerthellaceae bacterium]